MQKPVKITEEQAQKCGMEARELIAKGEALVTEMIGKITQEIARDLTLGPDEYKHLITEANMLSMDTISVFINQKTKEPEIRCVWTFEDDVYAYIKGHSVLSEMLENTTLLDVNLPAAEDLAPKTGKKAKPRVR